MDNKAKLSPMRAFAMELMASGPTTPGELKHAWFDHPKAIGKTFRRSLPCASRDAFGATSAAYQCLYSLEKSGLIQRTQASKDTSNNSTFTWYQYEFSEKGKAFVVVSNVLRERLGKYIGQPIGADLLEKIADDAKEAIKYLEQ